MANPKIRAAESDKESGPEVWIAAIYRLLPILQKGHDLIFIYSPGISDFNP
jgi:hypothetical protein